MERANKQVPNTKQVIINVIDNKRNQNNVLIHDEGEMSNTDQSSKLYFAIYLKF